MLSPYLEVTEREGTLPTKTVSALTELRSWIIAVPQHPHARQRQCLKHACARTHANAWQAMARDEVDVNVVTQRFWSLEVWHTDNTCLHRCRSRSGPTHLCGYIGAQHRRACTHKCTHAVGAGTAPMYLDFGCLQHFLHCCLKTKMADRCCCSARCAR